MSFAVIIFEGLDETLRMKLKRFPLSRTTLG